MVEISTGFIEKHWPITNVEINKILNTATGVRTVVTVNSSEGKYIYKIADEWKTAEALNKDLSVFELLPEKGFAHIPKLIKTKDDKLYSAIDEKFVYLMEYIEGQNPEPTVENYKKLGLLTAELHLVNNYPYETEFYPEPIINNELRTIAQDLPYKNDYLKIVETLPNFTNLPLSLIHTDISLGNSIEKLSGELVFIDWDDAGVGIRVLDIAFPLIQQFISEDCKFATDNARAFYSSYRSKIHLTDKELRLIFPAALFIALMYIIYGDRDKRWERIQWAIDNRKTLEDLYF